MTIFMASPNMNMGNAGMRGADAMGLHPVGLTLSYPYLKE